MSAEKKERRAALVRGFWNGLAGPASLFADPVRPEPAKMVEIKKLHRSIANPVDAMRADWTQVGADIHAAIKNQKQAS
jgi:hypothetical protein